MERVMKRFAVTIAWNDWALDLSHQWYDGPYWQLWLGPLSLYWALDGLPYIFGGK